MSSTDKYGLKEVADVYFLKLDNDTKEKDVVASADANGKLVFTVGGKTVGTASGNIVPAFTFETLKTSNIEIASEETSAKGGKGNPELISWSYGKTATITVTDALLSLETLGLMFGAKESANGAPITDTLTIDANSFPDTYMILGTTVLRPFVGGEDEPFAFIIPKAKVNVGGTLTMEAEGDPTTFEMTIKALAAKMGSEKDVLLKFVKPAIGALPVYRMSVGHTAATSASITIEGLTSGNTATGSDDLTAVCSADTFTVTVPSGGAIVGNVYRYTIADKAEVDVTIE